MANAGTKPYYDAALWTGLAKRSVAQGQCVIARERIAKAWWMLGFTEGRAQSAGQKLRRSTNPKYDPLMRSILRVQKQMADRCCRNGR